MKNKNKKIVSLKKVNKFYGKKHILKDVDMDIYEGDRIALIGGNGSGKSTLVEIISKIKEKSSGEITWDNNITIGVQFQESEYPIGITVKALINFYLNRFYKDLSEKVLNEYLDVFRLRELYKKQIVALSGGQKQRLNILLAIIHKPDLLILDELSTGLDIKIRRELRDYVMQYLKENKKVTMILITHSMGEASLMANRVVVLDWGVIKGDQDKKTIIKKYKSLEQYANTIFENMYLEENFATKKENS